MKLPGFQHSISRRGQLAFTMVEIALSLAIIAFALVAIIGVLPLGMGVQRENREETIVNQDATYFLDAIRSGARSLDDLTNYVFAITNYTQRYAVSTTSTNLSGPAHQYGFTFLVSTLDGTLTPLQSPIDNGMNIIGLLGTPKYVPFGPSGDFVSNHVVAFVHAMSGSAAEKYPQKDRDVQDLSFGYRLLPEVVPVSVYNSGSPAATNLQANLHELRLLFRWPLLSGGNVGNGRLVFRTLVGGQMIVSNPISPLYFFEPRRFAQAP